MITFNACFDAVIDHEGGYGADPADRGNWTSGIVGQGELKGTKFGIAAHAYPHLDIKALTLDQAREIYLKDYWFALRADDLPPSLRYYLFDTAVNCGVGFAAESLQRAAGALADGRIGPRTLVAVKGKGPHWLLRLMFTDRAMRYALNPNDRRFGPGWFARLYDVVSLTLANIDPRLNPPTNAPTEGKA